MMIKETLISVIFPVYNAAPSLRRCVDSLLRQSFRDFELILADDRVEPGFFHAFIESLPRTHRCTLLS